jgi:hypothetical protein
MQANTTFDTYVVALDQCWLQMINSVHSCSSVIALHAFWSESTEPLCLPNVHPQKVPRQPE